MAKKTLKIADKPTLDELKTLLEDSRYGLSALKSDIADINENIDRQTEYICRTIDVTNSSSYRTALNIVGSGKINAILCTGTTKQSSEALHSRITIDGDIIFNRGIHYLSDNVSSGGSSQTQGLGIIGGEHFFPIPSYGTTEHYKIPLINKIITKLNIDTAGFSFTNGATQNYQTSNGTILRIFKKPIKFNNSLKIEVYNPTYSITVYAVYELD